MLKFLLPLFLFLSFATNAQELFVFSEPSSTMAAHALSVNLSDNYTPYDRVYSRPGHRFVIDASAGIAKNFTLAVAGTFANMHTFVFQQEGLAGELKYRFLSRDDVQTHFRMAAFLQGGYSRAPFHYDETALLGDKTGLRLGVIATKLQKRFAFSASASHTQVLDPSRFNEVVYLPRRIYQAMNYSLSGGYLLLPRQYTSYQQVNVNVYGELLAQQGLDHKSFYLDAAPALQLIFFSHTKLNFGYRFQVTGTALRMSNVGWLIGLERTFLNIF